MANEETPRTFKGTADCPDGHFARVYHSDEKHEHWYGPYTSNEEAVEAGKRVAKNGTNTVI